MTKLSSKSSWAATIFAGASLFLLGGCLGKQGASTSDSESRQNAHKPTSPLDLSGGQEPAVAKAVGDAYQGALPSGTLFYSAGTLGTVYAMDLPSRQVQKLILPALDVARPIAALTMPARGRLDIQFEEGQECSLTIDSKGRCRISRQGLFDGVLSPDGKTIAVVENPISSSAGDLVIHDVTTGKSKTLVRRNVTRQNDPVWTQDGKRVLVWLMPKKDHEPIVPDLIDASTGVGTTVIETSTPLSRTSKLVFLTNNDVIDLAHRTVELEPMLGLSKTVPIHSFAGGLGLVTEAADSSDKHVPTFGPDPGDASLNRSENIYLIRYGISSANKLVTLARVRVYNINWDAGDGYAATYSPEKLPMFHAAKP